MNMKKSETEPVNDKTESDDNSVSSISIDAVERMQTIGKVLNF